MSIMMCLSLVLLILGLAFVASNPPPYFTALGLVLVAGVGCLALAILSGPFFSLILFWIYLGGMMVVFGYSAALIAEPFPESLGSGYVLGLMISYMCLVFFTAAMVLHFYDGPLHLLGEISSFNMVQKDAWGVALMYLCGGVLLVLGALVLLLALFVVFKLTWGMSFSVLRPV
ncbi:NADH dehydrogenase subunit 6 (mitochondrion) [Nothobranchius furzeri]|uniref:NADH-ubiquinone oxidoreductase chain 6 n=1 Tax=Nothobranchius furzeri TaxID=105023 RepID=B8QQJ0_NOTFU|nr:NADH dehydrogenase subunit 6 [Nothobranchius furzeri]ACD03819.1 NADH dehydrogenase subunit 6 [Nothobranchius furzeri]